MNLRIPQLTFRSFLLLALAVAPACDTESGDPGDNNAADGGGGNDTPDAGQATGDWAELVSGAWEIPAGQQFYRCARKTLTEDTYITGFKSIGPLGTHHTVLTVGNPSGPDGVSPCSAGTNAEQMIFGSGVGDITYNFPEGVGIKIPAGQQLLLNLHLFNVSDSAITGTSGTEAIMVSADKIVNEAEVVLNGNVSFQLPTGTSTVEGSCTMERDVTLLTVGPHMHQLGTHMKVEAIRAEGNMVLHDDAYDFYDQKIYTMNPVSMKQGDKIHVTCDYDNTTDGTVGFGDKSEEEMCFAGTYRYPKRASSPTGIACIF